MSARVKPLLLGLGLWCAAVLCGPRVYATPSYPTRLEVTATLRALDGQRPQRRFRSLAKILDRLRFTESVAHDEVMQFAFQQLVSTFKEKQYVEILRALDATPLDGGFAAALCSAYASMAEVPAFRSWYRAHARSIRRCVGESFSESDIARLTSEEGVAPTPGAEGGT